MVLKRRYTNTSYLNNNKIDKNVSVECLFLNIFGTVAYRAVFNFSAHALCVIRPTTSKKLAFNAQIFICYVTF